MPWLRAPIIMVIGGWASRKELWWEAMKQAIRENRRGKVRVAEYLILDDVPEVALLRSRMEVCEHFPDYRTRYRWFIGYAPEFEPLVVGERPPEYEAIFTLTCHNGHPGVELMFRRAG
jgi:hypothetical protein